MSETNADTVTTPTKEGGIEPGLEPSPPEPTEEEAMVILQSIGRYIFGNKPSKTQAFIKACVDNDVEALNDLVYIEKGSVSKWFGSIMNDLKISKFMYLITFMKNNAQYPTDPSVQLGTVVLKRNRAATAQAKEGAVAQE